MAIRLLDMLTRLFNMAEATSVALEGANPFRFVKKYPTRTCERFDRKRSSADWAGC